MHKKFRKKPVLIEAMHYSKTGHGSEHPMMRLPSFSGHPICTDLVSVREDVHCESTAQEVHAGVPA